jgi:hypothetical protein
MTIMRMFATSLVAIALLGAPMATAIAGEVKGPPGTVDNTNETGAPSHSNSACSYSGLNDMDSSEGQTASQVQTAADSFKYYGLPHGFPGKGGGCKGGTN